MLRNNGYTVAGARRGIGSMANPAVAKQGLLANMADLEQMVAEGGLQYGLEGGLHGSLQITARRSCIPGFQFVGNVATLAHCLQRPATGSLCVQAAMLLHFRGF